MPTGSNTGYPGIERLPQAGYFELNKIFRTM